MRHTLHRHHENEYGSSLGHSWQLRLGWGWLASWDLGQANWKFFQKMMIMNTLKAEKSRISLLKISPAYSFDFKKNVWNMWNGHGITICHSNFYLSAHHKKVLTQIFSLMISIWIFIQSQKSFWQDALHIFILKHIFRYF